MSFRTFSFRSVWYRSFAVCAVLLASLGCYKQERVNAVQHRSAWQREAGQSTQAAAEIARQSEKNTQDLKEALAKGTVDQVMGLQGKLVKMDGELSEKSDSSWTINSQGWKVLANVNDNTPYVQTPKSQISSCAAQGIIQQIDLGTKTIVLNDVELAPEMKGPMSENVATK